VTRPAQRFDAATAECHRITATDTVRLALVRAPDDLYDASITFEVWDVGGAQPPNSHPDSVETFWFLEGEGVAISDGVETEIRAGQFLVLPPGSLHQIRNTGTGRLYAITTMTPDAGFADLITAGPPAALDAEDLVVLRRAGIA
jgi:mannose-6-phosphate isomerase-like protein (cupin superfamily)